MGSGSDVELEARIQAARETLDAWVREVSEPILCYYTPVETLDSPRLQLLAPRAESESCEWAQ